MKTSRREIALTVPSFLWLILLFVVPTVLVAVLAFRPSDPYGGIGRGWTLAHLRSLFDPQVLVIAWRTLWISAVTTAACLSLAIPAGYGIARAPRSSRPVWLMLIVLPFWTSFLIRVFAWKSLLHPEGPVKAVLVALGLAGERSSLLYNAGAVILVNVYTFLPFAILPIYAAAEKFDFRLLEAARDLGAGRVAAFRRVFLPGVGRGLLTALLVVLIPSLGSFVIPDLVGGPTSEMLGNTIAQRVFVDRNLPLAAALSLGLILAVLVPLLAVLVLGRKRDRGEVMTMEGL